MSLRKVRTFSHASRITYHASRITLIAARFDSLDEATQVVGFDKHRNRGDARCPCGKYVMEITRLNAAKRDDRNRQPFNHLSQSSQADRRAVSFLTFSFKHRPEDDEI